MAIKSLIDHIGEDFGRVRVGYSLKSQNKIDSADFVLGKFAKEQQGEIPAVKIEVNAILTEYVFGGELPAETAIFAINTTMAMGYLVDQARSTNHQL